MKLTRRRKEACLRRRSGLSCRAAIVGVPAAFAFAIVAGLATAASAKDKAGLSKGDVEAKLAYCEVCHGVSAQGFHGYYPIPRLAGQQTEYLQNQLKAFIEHRRTNNIMFNVGHVLSPDMIDALAANFHDLNPRPLGGGPKDPIANGKQIFDEGVASANVPPCSSCHGEDGKGNGPFPRLAGQLYDYVTAKLTNWDKERGQDPQKPDTSAIMQPIAHSLNAAQIKAVAAYVSSLE